MSGRACVNSRLQCVMTEAFGNILIYNHHGDLTITVPGRADGTGILLDNKWRQKRARGARRREIGVYGKQSGIDGANRLPTDAALARKRTLIYKKRITRANIVSFIGLLGYMAWRHWRPGSGDVFVAFMLARE